MKTKATSLPFASLGLALLLFSVTASASWTGTGRTVRWIKVRTTTIEVTINGVSSSKCGSTQKVLTIPSTTANRSEMLKALLAAKLANQPVSIQYPSDSDCTAKLVMIGE